MAADAFLTLTGTGANRGVLSFAPEGTTTIASLNDWMRAGARTTLDLFRQGRVAHRFERDGAVENDDDGRTAGYVLTADDIDNTIYFADGLSVLATFATTNAANPSIKIIGIVGSDNGASHPLTASTSAHSLGSGVLEPHRPYLLLWQHNTRRWLVVGAERELTQQRLIVALADGGIPWAKLDVPDGSIEGAKIENNGIGTDQLADGAVRRNQIQAGVITGNKIQDGTITRNKLEAGALAWTNEVITTTGSAITKTFTAKEVEIEIWGAGGGGGAHTPMSLSPNILANAGANSILQIDEASVITIGGGYEGNSYRVGEPRLAEPGRAFTAYTDPAITGVLVYRVSGWGSGGGEAAVPHNNVEIRSGRSGDYARIFINRAAASITLIFTLGGGGAGGTNLDSRAFPGADGAPARALLRYR